MARKPESDLTGIWQGPFSYPRLMAPEFFTATLIEGLDFLGGSISEAAKGGPFAGKTFYASVSGKRDGSAVTFTKTYETSPRLHPVFYAGQVNSDFTEIEGTWTIPGNWSGKFLMIRQGGVHQSVGKKISEKV